MFPCAEISSTKSFPTVLPGKEKAIIFDIPGPQNQALPRRRLARRRLVSGDGAHASATFSRPQRGRTAKSLTEIHLVLVFPVFLKRRLVAAPLPLTHDTQGTLKQPSGGTRAPVTNDLVLTGGLAIPDKNRNEGTFAKSALLQSFLFFFERKQTGGFVKGWFWRMYPCSGFSYRRSVFYALVPALWYLPSSRFLCPQSRNGNKKHPAKPPFYKSTLCQPSTFPLDIP